MLKKWLPLAVDDVGRDSFRHVGLKPDLQSLFTTKARDIGLGLVVKNLVEANGGTVKVASEAGKGAMFFVTLPCDSSTIESA